MLSWFLGVSFLWSAFGFGASAPKTIVYDTRHAYRYVEITPVQDSSGVSALDYKIYDSQYSQEYRVFFHGVLPMSVAVQLANEYKKQKNLKKSTLAVVTIGAVVASLFGSRFLISELSLETLGSKIAMYVSTSSLSAGFSWLWLSEILKTKKTFARYELLKSGALQVDSSKRTLSVQEFGFGDIFEYTDHLVGIFQDHQISYKMPSYQ